MLRRRSKRSSWATWMLLQTRVPTSMTDWCISALTRCSRRSLPFASISVAMCERRSRVSGSMVWYSSSMPSVKLGRMVVASSGRRKLNTDKKDWTDKGGFLRGCSWHHDQSHFFCLFSSVSLGLFCRYFVCFFCCCLLGDFFGWGLLGSGFLA